MPDLDPVSEVRLNIGDREAPFHFSDAEVQHFIDHADGNLDVASGEAAMRLALYFATKADQTTGRMSVAFSKRAETYQAIASRFGITTASVKLAPVFVGGLSRAERASDRQETDLIQPDFERGLHDDPGSDPRDVHLHP